MQQYSTPTLPENSFRQTRLPLILIIVTLVAFNVLLYTRLTSDNPRPDLNDQSLSAAPAVQPVVQQSAVLDGRVGLTPLAGELDQSGWKVISGNWQADQNGLRQLGLADYDQTLVYLPQTFEQFAFDVTLRHLENVGGGILFNMQNTTSLVGSQLVRFEVDGSALYWGAFDASGQFEGQGYAPIGIDPFQSQRISVVSKSTAYDILLNDVVLASDIPLLWTQGYVGLAASQADVLYEQVDIRPITAAATAAVEVAPQTTGGLLTQSESISGEWVQADGVIRQLQNEATDYMTTLNVLGRTYTLEATVQLALEGAPADSGAGFIFHMRERDDRIGASMMRLVDQGKQLIWGVYDQNGDFQGAGSLELDVATDAPIKLAVRVKPTSYDIMVNDRMVMSELPLARDEGWVGLVAFRGGVEFSDVRLNIGE